MAVAVTLACGCAGEGEDDGPVASTTTTLVGAAPTLAQIQTEVFTPSCATLGCHDDVTRAAGLRLSSAQVSYDDLVGVASSCASRILVVAGDPDASYLLHKLGDGPAPCGTIMPAGSPTLDSALIADIRAWIADGAPAPAASSNTAAVSTTTSSTLGED
jgi:hypothetical protein